MQSSDEENSPRWIESAGNVILAALLASVLMGALQPLINGREPAANASCVTGERVPCYDHLSRHASAEPARGDVAPVR